MVVVEAEVRAAVKVLVEAVAEQEGLVRTIKVEIRRVAAARELTQVCLDHL
jgi:hypothetical protein